MIAKALFSIFLLSFALANTEARAVDRKCMPMQWEGVMFGKDAMVVSEQPKVFSIAANMSCDYTNQLQAIEELIEVDGGTERHAIILDYRKVRVHAWLPILEYYKRIY